MPFLRRDEVALYFEKIDGRAPPIVLLHGWCCDHTFLAAQAAHFAQAGRSVVAVDLRGHGRSEKPQQAYTMQVFADDVAWMCRQLGLAKPVLVGHSMGGIVAFDIATRHPELPAAIVMLNAAGVLPATARATIPPFLDKLRGPGYAARAARLRRRRAVHRNGRHRAQGTHPRRDGLGAAACDDLGL